MEKKREGAPTGNTNAEKQLRQNDAVVSESKATAERLAEEYGVSKRTIERDAKFSRGIDALAEVSEELAKAAGVSHDTIAKVEKP